MGKENNKSSPSRRQFLAASIASVVGIVLSGLVFFRDSLKFLYPGEQQKNFTKYLVAKIDEIPTGKAKEITIAGKPVFILHLPEGFKVYSGICTHLGCIVKWQEKEKQFYCPCHRAFFDQEGAVISGPAPRPLDEFKVEVENSLVFIWIKQRKGGLFS